MASVQNSRAQRIKVAADYISRGRATTRTFDSCFENGDGDEVAVTLYRRALADPDSALARNLWKYLSPKTVIPAFDRMQDQESRQFSLF